MTKISDVLQVSLNVLKLDNRKHLWLIMPFCIIYRNITEHNSFFTFISCRQSPDVETVPVGDSAKC